MNSLKYVKILFIAKYLGLFYNMEDNEISVTSLKSFYWVLTSLLPSELYDYSVINVPDTIFLDPKNCLIK